MVQTNQINIEFNYQEISNDFWIFKFETTNKSYKYSFIDDIKQKLKTVAVVYLQGKSFFALFSKADFDNNLRIYSELENVIGKNDEIKWKDIENLNFEIRNSEAGTMDKRQLAQLLINTLSGINDYNNVTGRLYYVISSKSKKELSGEKMVWSYTTLELTINYYNFPDKLCLLNNVNTFSNVMLSNYIDFTDKKLKDYPHYEINPTTRKMLRVPFGKTSKNIFINRTTRDNKKNDIDFLDFSNWTNFKTSKCGILYKFKKDVKKNLSKYFEKFEFVKLAENDNELKFSKNTTLEKDEKVKQFYKTTPIIINVDAITEETDKIKALKLAESLKQFITDTEKDYKIPIANVSIGSIANNALNFRIIHNKKYYDDKEDPKNEFLGQNKLIQHITLEDFADYENVSENEHENFQYVIPASKSGTSSPTLDNLFKELYIKNDIINGKITLPEWKLDYYQFVIREQIEIDKDNKRDIFHSLAINTSGELQFKTFRSSKESEFRDYKLHFESYSKNYNQEIDGLVFSRDNVNIIIRTELHTLPDLEKIGNDLEKKENDNSYLTSYIVQLIDDFCQINESLMQKKMNVKIDKDNSETFITSTLIDKLKNSLFSFKNEINKDEIKQKLLDAKFSGSTKFRKEFSWYFEQMTGDILDTFFKDESIRKDILSSNIGISYRQRKSGNNKIAMYYVGKKTSALQQKIDKATVLRKVVAIKGDLVFEDLLHTMNVDFVRNGALTVIPYPFKYLREMIEL